MNSRCEEGARDGIDIWYMGIINKLKPDGHTIAAKLHSYVSNIKINTILGNMSWISDFEFIFGMVRWKFKTSVSFCPFLDLLI